MVTITGTVDDIVVMDSHDWRIKGNALALGDIFDEANIHLVPYVGEVPAYARITKFTQELVEGFSDWTLVSNIIPLQHHAVLYADSIIRLCAVEKFCEVNPPTTIVLTSCQKKSVIDRLRDKLSKYVSPKTLKVVKSPLGYVGQNHAGLQYNRMHSAIRRA